MLKKVGIAVVFALLILIGLIAMQPSDFRLERKATIAAPPATVYALVDNFKAWDDWSPWAKIDPAMKKTLSGPERGVGAIYEWEGNDDVGKGRMEIIEAVDQQKIKIDLNFIAPFAARNETVFTFENQGDGTQVTWSMSGTNNFMAKAFDLFVDMDKMVGADFDKGLGQLKALSEKSKL
jgi:uncharacterized protein YndB with AHSA1/START domain